MVFLEKRLDTHIDANFLKELAVLYDSRGLFDMRLLLRDAMALEDEGIIIFDFIFFSHLFGNFFV